MSDFSNRLWVDPELVCARLYERKRGLRALLHDVPKLTGKDELAGTRYTGAFDEQYVATSRRPGEPSRHAWQTRSHRDFALEFSRAKNASEILGLDVHLRRLSLCDLHSHVVAYGTDLTLKIAHSSLARVVGDYRAERIVINGALLWTEPRIFQLALYEIALGDLNLLFFCVAGDLDDFHAVA